MNLVEFLIGYKDLAYYFKDTRNKYEMKHSLHKDFIKEKNSKKLFDNIYNYTLSYTAWSSICTLLCLGDRHLSNI